jgi:hypothetical protein
MVEVIAVPAAAEGLKLRLSMLSEAIAKLERPCTNYCRLRVNISRRIPDKSEV